MSFVCKKIIASSSAFEIKRQVLHEILNGVQCSILLLNEHSNIIFANYRFLDSMRMSLFDVLDKQYQTVLPSSIKLDSCCEESAIVDQSGNFCYALLLLPQIDIDADFTQTMSRFVSFLERFDLDALRHKHCVGELAVAIAEKLGLSEALFDALYFAAILMDFGDMFVSSEMTQHSTQVSDIEFSYVKAHPEVGYNLLKDIKFRWYLADIVHQHHERLDGSGYPFGLKNSDIMIEAKILAVADTIEAMASSRAYRKPFEMDVILKLVKRLAGVKFEPRIANAAVELFERDQYQLCTI